MVWPKAEGSKAEGFYVYYWYAIVWAVKESPNLYGDSYMRAKKRGHQTPLL
jgi:hypothetical protein